jgi:hypothetical protein
MSLFIRYIFIIIVSISSLGALAQQVTIGQGENSEELKNLSTTGFTLKLHINQVQFIKTKYGQDFYYRAQIPNFGKSIQVGNPQLPLYLKLIEIPANASYRILVRKMHFKIYDLKDYQIIYSLFPAQESVEKRENAPFHFRKNKAVYQKDAFYSESLYSIEELGEMRGQHIARLSISPVEYNPVKNQIKVYDELEIQVIFDMPQGFSQNTKKQKHYSPAFQNVSNYLLNASAYAVMTPIQGAQYPLKYVIVADSSFRTALIPFIKWKEKQGYKIIEAYTSDTAVGNTNASIKGYLQNLYNAGTALDPAPSYVLFVGDVTQIPKYPGQLGSWPADLYYCEFTNDYFPEMMYGRFSANDTSELIPQIEKTIEYEKYLMANPSYLDTCILISGRDASHAATYGDGQINYGTSTYFNATNNISCKSYLYINQSYNKDLEIRQNADSGAAFINYTAHGNIPGWYDPRFYTNNVANMQNAGKYPIMVGNACLTNKFDGPTTCFGEALLRARNKGAIAYIGASDNTFWDEDYYWAVGYGNISSNPTYATTTSGLYDLIFHTHGEPHNQWALTSYEYMQAGNMAVTQGGSNIRRYWELYHLMGDPSLMPYLNVPTPLTATYSPLLPLGVSSFNITTDAYALVAISRGDSLISSTYADSNGLAVLYFPPFTQAGNIDLVITASQKQVYFGNITAGSPNGPYIIYSAHQIIDSNGNNNAQADYNEHIKLNMELINITSHQADSAFAYLRSDDKSINFTDSVFFLGDFPGSDTLSFDSLFAFNVSANAIDKHEVKLYVYIEDSLGNNWTSHFFIKLTAPEIEINTAIIDDTQFGNSNGRIDPGETFKMLIPLSNNGGIETATIQCNLACNYSGVSIASSTYQMDTLRMGSTAFATFDITAGNSFKIGDIIRFDFDFNTNNRTGNKEITELVGFVDEDFETGDLSKFEWITNPQNPWFVQDTIVYEGNYSACSAPINDEDTSFLSITMKVLANDSISFYQKISCEENFDFLYFYIDDIVQGKWSGEKNWTRASYAVKEGIHNFKWAYIKDYINLENRDAAFVDMIAFPPTDAWTNVENAKEQLNSIKLMPNPAHNYSILSFEFAKTAKADIYLYDSKGQQIRIIKQNQATGGPQTIKIDTQNLSSGIYFIGIQNGSERWYKKLIVL